MAEDMEKRLRRKADQQWELAGLARQDGDMKASDEHTAKAREYDRQLGELIREGK
jgi:hypothetical protein